MKVALVFICRDSLGGAERRLIRIYSEICKAYPDVECSLAVRACNKETFTEITGNADCDIGALGGVMCFERPIDSLWHILVSREYDIIHCFDACRFNILCQIAGKLTGKKNLYTVCGYAEAYNLLNQKQMRKVRTQLKLADAVDLLYPSGEKFIKSIAAKIPVGITPGTFTDLTVFSPREKNKTMLFAAARLEEGKNPMLLIEACAACREQLRRHGYRVVILGKGVLEETMKKRILECGLEEIVQMAGYAKTSLYLPEADVFFSLQKGENYPSQSLAEAAACGCYCIITDVGDSRNCADETFASFVNADPRELAAEICAYMEKQDEQKTAIIKNARNFAEKHYTIDRSKDYFVRTFKEMVKS